MDGALSEREHGELAELASIEALGALDAPDRARLALHLRAGCATCLAEVQGGRRVGAALAALATPLPVPGALRARVLGSLASGSVSAPPATERRAPLRREGLRTLARAAASLAAAAALAVVGVRGFEAFERELGLRHDAEVALELERALRHDGEIALARAEAEREAALGERERLVALIETVGAPAARAVALAGAENIPSARGRAFVEPVGHRIVLLVYDLPPPPPGRTYQLWTIEGGKPASAGVFATSDAGQARHAIATPEQLGDTLFLAVTVEPAGGVPQPTGPIVMAQR